MLHAKGRQAVTIARPEDTVMRRLSVALLSIVILFGSLLLGGGRLVAAQDATPVAGDEEAPPEGLTFELLGLGETDVLPSAPAEIGLVRVTLAPGTSFPGEADDPSIALVVIEAGAITFNFEVPITVLHPVGNEEPTAEDFEEMPAGQDFTMEVGDSALFPASVAGEVRNDGTENAVALAAFIEPSGEEEATPVS
jgi:quercetin dioxygenase-like cupin family protein